MVLHIKVSVGGRCSGSYMIPNFDDNSKKNSTIVVSFSQKLQYSTWFEKSRKQNYFLFLIGKQQID